MSEATSPLHPVLIEDSISIDQIRRAIMGGAFNTEAEREAVLDALCTIEQIGEAHGRGQFTVRLWAKAGLKTTKIAGHMYSTPRWCREFHLAQARGGNPEPRQPGRPRRTK